MSLKKKERGKEKANKTFLITAFFVSLERKKDHGVSLKKQQDFLNQPPLFLLLETKGNDKII